MNLWNREVKYMSKYFNHSTILFLFLMILTVTYCSMHESKIDESNIAEISNQPRIDPDYTDIIIPPNIAPTNFIIQEDGIEYYVKISSSTGKPIEIYSESSDIRIPINPWKCLLETNKGEKLVFDILAKSENGTWQKYKSINNKISNDKIDSHLAYRLIMPAHNYWNEIGIHQRNLQNFDESPILLNKMTGDNCMNCHNFRSNNPDNMLLHIRKGPSSGTLLVQNGKVKKINTSTDFNRAGAYPSWHPNGKLIAFSANNLMLFFHAQGPSRDVLDRGSDLILYDIESNMVTTSPQVSGPERMENFPWWSPDGKYLYYSSAPGFDNYVKNLDGEVYLDYDKIRYDLMRIPYDIVTGEWGQAETVLSSEKTGLTILEPRISPDGRYMLVTMTDYGNFPIYMHQSDVYIINLEINAYKRLEINSDESDSFHSWSSNGRWFAFASKRRDGVLGRVFFSHFDENAIVSKPFLMPQEDPTFHSTFFKNYNVPELIKGPVKVTAQELRRVAYDNENMLNAKLDPKVQVRIKNLELQKHKHNQTEDDSHYSQQ